MTVNWVLTVIYINSAFESESFHNTVQMYLTRHDPVPCVKYQYIM